MRNYLDRDEQERLIYLLIEKSGLAKGFSREEKEQLAKDTCDNLDKAGVELSKSNLRDPEMQKKLMLTITATFIENVAKRHGLEFKFDFNLINKNENELTPDEKKKLDAVEKLVGAPEEQIVDFVKELSEELKQDPSLSPSFELVAVYDESGNKIVNVGPMIAAGKGARITLSNFYQNNSGNDMGELLQEEFFGPEGIVEKATQEAGLSNTPRLTPNGG